MIIQILIFGSGFVLGVKNRKHHQKLNSRQNLNKKKGNISKSNRAHTLKKIISNIKNGDKQRLQQIKQMTSDGGRHSENILETKLNKNIKRSVGLMGLSLFGTVFYAPVLPFAAAGILYIFTPVFKNLFLNLKKRRISTELIEIVSVVSFLASGYYVLAAFITFTSLLCLKLLTKTEYHSKKQLINIFNQKQRTTWILKNDIEVEIPLEEIKLLDIIVVNAGEIIPVDGIITSGIASIDQHSISGESKPVEVEAGDKVLASSLVLTGRILVEVEKTGLNTNASKIGQILEQTQEYKETQRLRGKKIADKFIAPTLVVSGLTLPLFGASAAMAMIWTAFGYNMKLYGPISVLNFLNIMVKNGILIKDGRSLEMLQKVDTIVFDKTGTLTMEQPLLACLHPIGDFDEKSLLIYAAAAENRQSHPIAKAIVSAAKQRKLDLPIIEQIAYMVGYGIKVTINTEIVLVGSSRYMEQEGILFPDEMKILKAKSETKGFSLVYVAVGKTMVGALELQTCIRPEAKEIVSYIKSQDIDVCIISGDHEPATRQLADELGIEQYYSETLPAQKAEIIKKMRASGKFVAYIGDGINDAIALKQANVSISLRGASTVATDTAQIILMDGNLEKLKSLLQISHSFEANMRNNYLASIVPGIITMTGVFFFQMGLAGSLVVYFSSKIVGLANTMLPLAKQATNKTAVDIRPISSLPYLDKSVKKGGGG